MCYGDPGSGACVLVALGQALQVAPSQIRWIYEEIKEFQCILANLDLLLCKSPS